MNKQIIIIMMGLIILALPMINAAQPVYEQNVINQINVPCTNNGTYCSATATCNATILNPSGDVIINNQAMTKNNSLFNYSLTADQSSEVGQYELNIACVDGGLTNSKTLNFFISTTGEKVELPNIIVVIVFLCVAGMFLFFGFIFKKEKWILKTFFYLCAILMSIIAVNAARVIASESTDLSTMSTSGFLIVISVLGIMFMYLLIYATIEILNVFKRRGDIAWGRNTPI